MDRDSVKYGRGRLLPNLSLLALLEVGTGLLPHNALLFSLGLIAMLVVVAYVVLATRDMLADVEQLNPVDRWICRWSGPLALLIGVVLLLMVVTNIERPVSESWVASRRGLFTIKLAMEVGFILTIACWCAPPKLRHVPPVILWRIIVVPLMLVYGLYFMLIPVSQLAGDCDQGRSPISGLMKQPQ